MSRYETRTQTTLENRRSTFLTRVQEVHHRYPYDYSKVNYVNAHTPVTIGCPVHGEFEKTPKQMMDGTGCPACGKSRLGWNVRGTKQHRQQLFIEKSNRKHAFKYDYSNVRYVDGKTKVEIICPHHGPYHQTPDSHMNSGLGCAKCNTSRGESLVRWWLKRHRIEHTEQQSFEGCVFKKPLKFDFYVPSHNIAIECNGKQHYEPAPIFHGTNAWNTFEIQQQRDLIKQQWATSNGMTLITIPYYEYDQIWDTLSRLFPQQVD